MVKSLIQYTLSKGLQSKILVKAKSDWDSHNSEESNVEMKVNGVLTNI